MLKIGFIFILVLEFHLFAKGCFSIITTLDNSLPVNPFISQEEVSSSESCKKEKFSVIPLKKAYYGCYKTKQKALNVLNNPPFNFINPKIIYRIDNDKEPSIISPEKSTLSSSKIEKTLTQFKIKYRPDNLEKKLPTHFYGNGIDILNIDQIDFLPFINLYAYYKTSHQKKVLIIYDGVYTLEMIYKKLKNNNYIQKINKGSYAIKIPLIISPTAKLIIQNKTLYLQSDIKSVFIFYYGELYLFHNKIYAWDFTHNKPAYHQTNSKENIFRYTYTKQNVFITGLTGSKTYFVDNIFQGISSYSPLTSSGISLLDFPKKEKYFSTNGAFEYFLSQSDSPTGYYIGNDVTKSIMAFQAIHAKNVIYLGNYIYDNLLYGFNAQKSSKNILFGYNIALNSQKSHSVYLSDQTNNSTVTNNIILDNNGSGIMLKNTYKNSLNNNISFSNRSMGISLINNDDTLIKKNNISFNYNNGLQVKNSTKISIQNNIIGSNAINGIKITASPSHPSTLFIQDNLLKENLNKSITAKYSVAIALQNNHINNPNPYGGALEYFSDKLETNKTFFVYAIAFPTTRQILKKDSLSSDTLSVAKKIYLELNDMQNQSALKELGIFYLSIKDRKHAQENFEQASLELSKGSLQYLGYLYLTDAKKNHFTNKTDILTGLSFIIEDLILQNKNISSLQKLTYFLPNGKEYFQEAFKIAKQRMENGNIFSQDQIKKCSFCRTIKQENMRKIKHALNIFLYKMQLLDTESINTYLETLYQRYTLFTSQNILTIEKKIKHYNQQIKSKDPLSCKINSQKHSYYKQQTDSIIQELFNANLAKTNIQFQQKLQEINSFRNHKITLEELLQYKGNKNEH